MANIFLSLTQYGGSWKVTSERKFTAEEIASSKDAEVVESEYGLSMQVTLNNGNRVFIPLSNDAASSLGDKVDLTTADLLTLEKDGEEPILRVRC